MDPNKQKEVSDFILREIATALFPSSDPNRHVAPPAMPNQGAREVNSRLNYILDALYLNQDKDALDNDLSYHSYEAYPRTDFRQPESSELEFEEVDLFNTILANSSLNKGEAQLHLRSEDKVNFDDYIEIESGSNVEDVVDLETRYLLLHYINKKEGIDTGILLSISDLSANYFRVKRDGLDLYSTMQIALINNLTEERGNIISSALKREKLRNDGKYSSFTSLDPECKEEDSEGLISALAGQHISPAFLFRTLLEIGDKPLKLRSDIDKIEWNRTDDDLHLTVHLDSGKKIQGISSDASFFVTIVHDGYALFDGTTLLMKIAVQTQLYGNHQGVIKNTPPPLTNDIKHSEKH